MTWGMVAIGGGVVASGVIGASAAKSAASKQANAATNAADAQLQQFNTINQQQAPYRQSGYGALGLLNNGLGIAGLKPGKNLTLQDFQTMQATPGLQKIVAQSGGDQWAQNAYNNYLNGNYGEDDASALQNIQQDVLAAGGGEGVTDQIKTAQTNSSDTGFGNLLHQFGAADLATNLSPSYNFMLQQGLGTAANEMNATGGLVGGNALQGLNKFAQDYASTGYQQAYQNYNANQTNIFNRLADIAGIGQTANQSTANAGIATTNAAGNYNTSAAAASAAGTIGQANAINSSINNASGWGFLYGGGAGGASDSLSASMARAGANGLGAV